MAKYVPDIKTQRWIIIARSRALRPDDGKKDAGPPVCPFCTGHEQMTPPETFRMGSGDANHEGWDVRVVPNKFPITDIHEVVIHSPHHEHAIEELPDDQVQKIVKTYRERYRAHETNGQVLIFCNQGLHAGASLSHPHSQIVVVPRQINLDALSCEPIANIVEKNDMFVTYCPDFSQWPFEVWIAPKNEGSKFGAISEDESTHLAGILKHALVRLKRIHSTYPKLHGSAPFGYNFYIYHGINWFVRIIPRFIHRAGFELGTGLSVNIVDPTDAARMLAEG